MTLTPRREQYEESLRRRARMEGRQPPSPPSPGSREALKAEIRAEVMAEVDAKLRGLAAQVANLYAEHDAINIRQERDSARIDGLLISRAKESEKQSARREDVPEFFTVPVNEVIAGVAEFYEIDRAELMSKQRRQHHARARQVFVALMLKLTAETPASIGRLMAGRDHSTINHAHRAALRLFETDPAFAAEFDAVAQLINSNIENSEGDA